jgi:hypothetical protein
MKVLSGHLTATEKKHIKAILDQKLMTGKIGRKSYWLSLNEGLYTVKVIQNDRGWGWIGAELRQSVYTHTFTL